MPMVQLAAVNRDAVGAGPYFTTTLPSVSARDPNSVPEMTICWPPFVLAWCVPVPDTAVMTGDRYDDVPDDGADSCSTRTSGRKHANKPTQGSQHTQTTAE